MALYVRELSDTRPTHTERKCTGIEPEHLKRREAEQQGALNKKKLRSWSINNFTTYGVVGALGFAASCGGIVLITKSERSFNLAIDYYEEEWFVQQRAGIALVALRSPPALPV